ncbi:hypothetical protein Ocin01_01376 [Orchesella cincta]|uniref:DUF4789 domain-containing protein n=1 Tax=Orchesella cincta TaxID=48709 RepID=A0A1D2NK26_ORCCI|nr:hypothetical protein Ocin01_01376 [Orchesella cincta]
MLFICRYLIKVNYFFYLLVFLVIGTATLVSSQNEAITTEDKLLPGCPTRGSETLLRYKKDNKCYKANSQGPCPENMILFPHPSAKTYGFCDCFDARGETPTEVAYLNNRNLSHCIPEVRAQVYVPERNRCYSVFDQGPCANGKWLVLNSTNYPVCAKNTCLNDDKETSGSKTKNALSPEFVFALSSTSKCYRTMSKGYCIKSKCNLEESTVTPNWSDETSLSLPPCHSFGEKLWLHHVSGENLPICFEAGTQGPCGESMTFYKDPRKTFETVGFCDCDDVVEVKSDIPECEVIQRPLIYYPHHNRCYAVFSQVVVTPLLYQVDTNANSTLCIPSFQESFSTHLYLSKGPCLHGMWLVLDDNRNPTCTSNVCLRRLRIADTTSTEDDYGLSFWFSENDECYRTQTRGYCNAGFVLKVVKNNWRPECQRDIEADCIMTEEVNIASLQCRPGNRLDSLRMCDAGNVTDVKK